MLCCSHICLHVCLCMSRLCLHNCHHRCNLELYGHYFSLILELAWALCAIFSTFTCKHLIVAKISLILQKYSTLRKYLACGGETRPSVTIRCQHWTEINGQPCSQYNEQLYVCVRACIIHYASFTHKLSPRFFLILEDLISIPPLSCADSYLLFFFFRFCVSSCFVSTC